MEIQRIVLLGDCVRECVKRKSIGWINPENIYRDWKTNGWELVLWSSRGAFSSVFFVILYYIFSSYSKFMVSSLFIFFIQGFSFIKYFVLWICKFFNYFYFIFFLSFIFFFIQALILRIYEILLAWESRIKSK